MSALTLPVLPMVEAVPLVDPSTADGTFSLLWLVVGLPLLGAAVLLLGGRFTDRWGHWLATALPIGSFAISVLLFVELLGRGEEERRIRLRSRPLAPASCPRTVRRAIVAVQAV